MIIEKRDKAAQVGEMRQGLRRLRLACRLGTSVRDLVAESIEVPREAIGRVSHDLVHRWGVWGGEKWWAGWRVTVVDHSWSVALVDAQG